MGLEGGIGHIEEREWERFQLTFDQLNTESISIFCSAIFMQSTSID